MLTYRLDAVCRDGSIRTIGDHLPDAACTRAARLALLDRLRSRDDLDLPAAATTR